MNTELIEIKISKPEIPDDWNFEKENHEFDELVYGWRRLTIPIMQKLWVFYNKLKKQGKRNDLSENSDKLPSWLDWIESKGIDPDTVLNHFRKLDWISSKTLVLKHTGNQENYTPKYIIDYVKNVMNEITLDPASCPKSQKTIKAKEYFTEKDDGLSKKWYGNIFLNPPYQYPLIEDFINKLISELPNIKSAILLTNNNTDTQWFYNAAMYCTSICFTRGRINFYTETIDKTQPTNGQTFFYFGDDTAKFIKEFSQIGICMNIIK